MKKPSRFLRVLGAAGLLIGLLAATIAPVSAQPTGTPDQDGLEALIALSNAGFRTGDNSIYYPWVANGENFGLGPSQTSISVQNLEDRNAIISIFVGDEDGGFDLVTTAFLSAYAAKTFSAGDLGIAEGDGAPVAVLGFATTASGGTDDIDFPNAVVGSILAETPVILSKPEGVEGDFTQVTACVVNAYSDEDFTFGTPVGFVVSAAFSFEGVDYSPDDDDDTTDENSVFDQSFTQEELQEILEDANDGNTGALINPFGGLNDDADCFDVRTAGTPGSLLDSVILGGVAKQTAEAGGDDNGDDGAETQQVATNDTAVSGYNALNGSEVFRFDEWYLPIVQTNCGPGGCWDTVIRVANVSNLNNAVTIRFFPADDGSGSLQTGFQIQDLVDGGDTWNVNLSDLVPEGWVGTAHIFSDGGVFAMADRFKVGYNMWITNSGSSADFENLAQVDGANGRFALFAPHVLMDYFGWNTGINVANLVNDDNNISIQYFNLLGNATEGLNQRLAPHGMTYFYDPSQAPQDLNEQDVTTDPNAGVVGSAIIWSESPVAAVVDATKYPESDPNGGEDVFQATSYSATQNVFTWQAVPLVQKGNAIDGSGATSGINIMNPNSTAVTADVFWVNPSGFLADNFGTSSVTIPGFANGFVYTLWQHNLPNGFTGAAQVVASQPVAAVSANVNYDVEGDGSAIFNAFNPCGFFRVAGECNFGDPFTPGGQSITKTFVDEDGEGVPGVNFTIVNTDGSAPYQGTSVSGADGSRTFSNVPVGVYELFVNTVPAGFVLPTGVVDTIVVVEGADVTLTNELEFDQGFLKTVCVAQFDEDLVDPTDPFNIPFSCDGTDDLFAPVTLGGVNVVVYENVGEDGLGGAVAGDIVFEGVTGADGTVGGNLAPGDYILCIFDADGEATTGNGEVVDVALPDEATVTLFCGVDFLGLEFDIFGDLFTVEAGVVTELENPAFLERGAINMFVGVDGIVIAQSGAEDLDPLAGVQVCVDGPPTSFDPQGNPIEFYDECEVSDENGNVKFEDAPGLANFDFGFGNLPTSASLQGAPSEIGDDSEFYTVTVSDTDNDYDCVSGGELTAEVIFGEECGAPLLNQAQTGEFDILYSPTLDVIQDGWSDDEGQTGGSYDVVVEMLPAVTP